MKRPSKWLTGRVADRVALAVLIVLYIVGFVSVRAESEERRDQNCISFERQEQQAVNQIIRTYAYLDLPASRRDPKLTRVVVEGLPTQEAEARASFAPTYCNEPNVGLPELKSDPRMPKHRDFSYLLKSRPEQP